ncbi:reverse transcriptase domain-containing protein [Sorangium sp. So ce1182]|uniref:reverse transcriptase domain-containing protein n=1 Tax=Sorangium sp. So ce1182 TaxID=3133334 RepID=UPI003F602F49
MGGEGGAATTSSSSGAVCVPGAQLACYSGPPGTEGVGHCVAGLRTCNESGTGYGACEGEVLPSAERCATPGDEDCNGASDEDDAGCVCVPGTEVLCYAGDIESIGVGACQAGRSRCNEAGSGFGPCLGQVLPAAETCATEVDDDCDGAVNEEGAGCACLPHEVVPCYAGPPGTEGVGACAAGTATCDALGTSLGPCEGEVLPAPEVCATGADEDCDGSECPSHTLRAAGLGGPGDEGVTAVAADAEGNLYVTGWFTGTVDFGAGPLVCAGGRDVFLLKLDPAGRAIWSKRFGSKYGEWSKAIAVDASGNILLGGDYDGDRSWTFPVPPAVDFGGGPLPWNDREDSGVFVVKLDPSGNHLFSYGYVTGSPWNSSMEEIAVDAAGNVFLLRNSATSESLGRGIRKFDPARNILWSHPLPGDFGYGRAGGIAVDSAGNLLTVAGYAHPYYECCDEYFRVEKRDPAGAVLWQKAVAGPVHDEGGGRARDVAVDPEDNVLVLGRDGAILRLIGKWLNAGVLEDGNLKCPDAGSPQGGVVSPILANVLLREVFDVWFAREVRPRMRGRVHLVRYADDAVMLFEYEEDARRVMAVLPKRFGKYGLTLHPDKTHARARDPGRARARVSGLEDRRLRRA